MEAVMLDSKKDARSALIVDQVSAAKEILANDQDMFGGVEILAKYNKHKYNALKLAEELAELSEVVLKYETKATDRKPSIQSIVDEAGDVMVRMGVYLTMMSLELENDPESLGNQAIERAEAKLKKLLGFISEGKYPGGV